MPMGGRRIQPGPTVGGNGFINFPESGCADENAIAFNECQIRRGYQRGSAQ